MRSSQAASPGALPSARTRIADVITLTKARVNALVVATTAGGYYMASQGPIDPGALVVTCLGTALVASGAAAYNQVTERETDRLMDRTRLRPVADRRMTPAEGRMVASALSVTGILMLWLGVNPAAAIVAFATLLIYAAVYTPLKRRTSVSTIIGAVPGALPPLIGWAGAGASLADPAPWARSSSASPRSRSRSRSRFGGLIRMPGGCSTARLRTCRCSGC